MLNTNGRGGNRRGRRTLATNNHEASSAPNIPSQTPAFVTPRPNTTRAPEFATPGPNSAPPRNTANNGETVANQAPVHSQSHTIHAPRAVRPHHPDSIYNRHANEGFTLQAQTNTEFTATDMLHQDGALRQYCRIHTPQEILSIYQTLSTSYQAVFWRQITGVDNIEPSIPLDEELLEHLYDRIPEDLAALGLTACVHRYGLDLWSSRFNLFSSDIQQEIITTVRLELVGTAAGERMMP